MICGKGFFKTKQDAEAAAQRCSVKKVFLNIEQNSQKNTCVRVSFLVKLQAEACNFAKKFCFTFRFSREASLLKRGSGTDVFL